MISTQTLKGNLIRQDYTTAFVLNQGDKGVPFKIELLENGAPYILQSTDIVTIEWLKPNGSPFLQEGDIKYGTTYIEFTTPEAIAQCNGSGSFNIIISNGDLRKGTIRREYKVIPTSFKPGSISEDVITDAITELRELSLEIADTVQNNQDLINNNQAATKQDIANVNSSLEDITNDLYVRSFSPRFDQSITVGHVNGTTGQTSTRTEEQLLTTLKSYKNLGIDGVYIFLHVGINTSTNQLFVAGGDDYKDKVNYIITQCGNLGLEVRAIKIHQETTSGQMKLSDITSSIGIDSFKTQYANIIDDLTTTFAGKTSNFLILNEFEEIYSSSTYQDFCTTLITNVKNKGFNVSISCLAFGSFLKMTDANKNNLDFISINFYPPIGFEGVNTSLDTATNIFLTSNVVEYIDLFVKTYNKPIYITETGCMDIAEAMVYGYRWTFDDMTTYNGEIQKIFLNCIFTVLNDKNVKSVGYWWDLDSSLSNYIKTYLGKEDR